jgi:DNA-binding transcriptional regulator YdaS (Cro superfamily)
MENQTSAIRRACELVGGQSALARLLNIAPPTVNEWVKGDRRIPAERCPEIEDATDKRVTCEELRPDVRWSVLRGEAKAA